MNTLQQLRAGELTGSRRVKLACGLREFPQELFALADTLEILDLSGNALRSLPDDLPRLNRLRIIFCSDNPFTELPAVLGRCANLEMVGFKANRISHVPAAALPPKLRWLILTDNCLETLPPELGHCRELQKLMLAGNRLQHLPETLAQCNKLELLRIAANQLPGLPDWLLELPRLSWLAYAGNPFCAEIAWPQDSTDIDWQHLELDHKLGEGASGVIHRARYRQGGGDEQAVAVKLFKGEITSDGLPLNEMAACLQAGAHPHLIPVLGRIESHPEDTYGLVLALIDERYRSLAGPPSLDSCTRDVYPPGTRFALPTALHIAFSIASAAAHLHAQGINHGDLYGHNILHGDAGHALLGDFGAASLLDCSKPEQKRRLQQIEVRAFACLLEELLAHCTCSIPEESIRQQLLELQTQCMQPDAAARPLFADIVDALQHHLQSSGVDSHAALHQRHSAPD